MRIFGIDISLSRAKAQTQQLAPVAASGGGGWFNVVTESFSGAFQRLLPLQSKEDVLSFSPVYSCVTMIAGDIAKLCLGIVRETEDDICVPVSYLSPFLAVLRKPNAFQNRYQFIEQWVVSKLLHGNTYALKERDARGIITRLYILDATKVKPMVGEDGSVWYRLSPDNLTGLTEGVVVPASEIIHDRMCCLWHPLVGVSPIYACGMSAMMGTRIQNNSSKFFDNMSRPSGVLSAPGRIQDDTAKRLKEEWEKNYTGSNIGRLAVLGDGLKYEAMTIPARDAQLAEQLGWTAQDIARTFHVPFFKIGGPVPLGTTVDALNQMYYCDCLQELIESMELCFDEGLELPAAYYTELDTRGLMRMDTGARYEANSKAVGGGWMRPNEARRLENLPPEAGGESCYLQQQNYSLSALAKRDGQDDPFASKTAALLAPSADDPNPDDAAAEDDAQVVALVDYVTKGLLPCPAS